MVLVVGGQRPCERRREQLWGSRGAARGSGEAAECARVPVLLGGANGGSTRWSLRRCRRLRCEIEKGT